MFLKGCYFKEHFDAIFGKKVDIVSSIDHPYASPPIRLISGHHNFLELCKKNNFQPAICIWDVNFPTRERYKYELSFDSGILNSPTFANIFSDNTLYPNQVPQELDYELLERMLIAALNRLNNVSWSIKKERNVKYIERFKSLARIYRFATKNSSDGSEFYLTLMRELYDLLEMHTSGIFFASHAFSYYKCTTSSQWIAYCMKKTKGTLADIRANDASGVFTHPFCRYREDIETEMYLKDFEYDEVVRLMDSGMMIPSYEVFFWSLWLAGVRHFGNDYGFFSRLDAAAAHCRGAASLQMTRHNEDSVPLVEFIDAQGFSIFQRNGQWKFGPANRMKKTRQNSITALYLSMGEVLSDMVIKQLNNDGVENFGVHMAN